MIADAVEFESSSSSDSDSQNNNFAFISSSPLPVAKMMEDPFPMLPPAKTEFFPALEDFEK